MLSQGPWDGVAYDRAYGVPENDIWRHRVGERKIRRLNRALVQLMAETKRALGADRIVLYNGLKDRDAARMQRRNLAPLEKADGVANEYFCYHKNFGFDARVDLAADILGDLRAQSRAADEGRLTLVHVTYQDKSLSAAAKRWINRFCYGSFLLGHRPGLTSYKFGFLTTQLVLDEDAAEQEIDLGVPVSGMLRLSPGVFQRRFDNGLVVVNLSETDAVYRPDKPVVLMHGAVAGASYSKRQEIALPARDAIFLLDAESR